MDDHGAILKRLIMAKILKWMHPSKKTKKKIVTIKFTSHYKTTFFF